MTRLMIALGLVAGLTAAPVLAQDAPTIADTDGNGLWSMEELKAAYPSLTEETFAAMDTSADGQIDQAELDAAMGAKLLMAE
ncbi:EF-hand domain-containing protein [Pseudorhodobacter sp. E13]|uniref:EF-hand domain-containing protein n=1 Tax=Pseudorhodobacter sp. E13 TaxID=2487931 RepID=UPI000F8D6F64|nr:EF-hand domain-containing protein [Pseudorhodobacter sp. E13]RUS58820.1 EF-hand domain-containing protein [Pseudorhodobacter sp. E13]